MSDPIRSELGAFLRSRREKLTPDSVGLRSARRRRTPGLRREEVAELAGIGVDWYVRLEQGRAVHPSSATIDALARALRLSKVEHGHLKALARNTGRAPFVRERVPEPLRRMVEGLGLPAYITGRRWDVLAWNPAAADLIADFSATPEPDRNILVYMLLDPAARRLFGDGWAEEARRIVALFRVNHDIWAGDPAFISLLDRLSAGQPQFAAWWDTHDVRAATGGQKRLHPSDGPPRLFEHASFQAIDDPALRLVIYTPV